MDQTAGLSSYIKIKNPKSRLILCWPCHSQLVFWPLICSPKDACRAQATPFNAFMYINCTWTFHEALLVKKEFECISEDRWLSVSPGCLQTSTGPGCPDCRPGVVLPPPPPLISLWAASFLSSRKHPLCPRPYPESWILDDDKNMGRLMLKLLSFSLRLQTC